MTIQNDGQSEFDIVGHPASSSSRAAFRRPERRSCTIEAWFLDLSQICRCICRCHMVSPQNSNLKSHVRLANWMLSGRDSLRKSSRSHGPCQQPQGCKDVAENVNLPQRQHDQQAKLIYMIGCVVSFQFPRCSKHE